jgi:hypothetical protein
MLLAGGATWQAFSHTAVEAELMAARTLTREEIAMVYDVPPPMIGDLTHGTYSQRAGTPFDAVRHDAPSVAEADRGDVAGATDRPGARCGRRRDLRRVRPFRGSAWSPKDQLDALAAAFGAGLITLNEARKELNMPRLDDPSADKPFIPTNNQAPLDGGAPSDQAPPLLA